MTIPSFVNSREAEKIPARPVLFSWEFFLKIDGTKSEISFQSFKLLILFLIISMPCSVEQIGNFVILNDKKISFHDITRIRF